MAADGESSTNGSVQFSNWNTLVRLFSSSKDKVLPTDGLVDLIEEMRLRTWARQNYTEPKNRAASWPNIVHDEMERRDSELERQAI